MWQTLRDLALTMFVLHWIIGAVASMIVLSWCLSTWWAIRRRQR